jgi:putative two-component system response regulator
MARILVVDDENSIRITLQAFLQKEGYEVDLASDANTAIEMIEHQDYDVILTDIIMPKVSGIELLHFIRARSKDIQVIIMTGEPTVDSAIHAVKNGANDYLAKPINKETLLLTIRRAVELKTLNDEKVLYDKERGVYLLELEDRVNVRTQELQEALQSIVLMLSYVVEYRDPYTAGHQRRVGNLAAEIADQMGCDKDTIQTVRLTGYLHDIGKMVVPAEILNKPGKLSDIEMSLIRTHSEQGYEMLHRINLPKNIAEIVRQHHERLNGSGYPMGLKDDEILKEARIIAVADVVEAMISYRPYRPALGVSDALSEIKEKSGILYCPQAVEACLTCRRKTI